MKMSRWLASVLVLSVSTGFHVQARADLVDTASAAVDRADYQTAHQLLFPLAEEDNAKAQADLGRLYLEGLGIERDEQKALIWFRRSASQGFASGQVWLGICYDRAQGVEQDFTEAARWYRRAAEQGHPAGQYNLGIYYWYGKGGTRDRVEAISWFRRAAEQGDRNSQYWLGVAYKSGNGVAKDEGQAANWLRKAADQGHADALTTYALMLERGQGIEPNPFEALAIYRQQAENGDARAQLSLGLAYIEGVLLPKDFVRGYLWLSLSQRHGAAHATDLLEILALNMSDRQLARARSAASKCLENNFKDCEADLPPINDTRQEMG